MVDLRNELKGKEKAIEFSELLRKIEFKCKNSVSYEGCFTLESSFGYPNNSSEFICGIEFNMKRHLLKFHFFKRVYLENGTYEDLGLKDDEDFALDITDFAEMSFDYILDKISQIINKELNEGD